MSNRRHIRIQCEINAKIKYGTTILSAKIDDLSAGGCRLYGDDELYINLKRHDIITIEFAYNDELYFLQAKVIRDMFSPKPVSVEFTSVDKITKQKLDNIIIKDYLNN